MACERDEGLTRLSVGRDGEALRGLPVPRRACFSLASAARSADPAPRPPRAQRPLPATGSRSPALAPAPVGGAAPALQTSPFPDPLALSAVGEPFPAALLRRQREPESRGVGGWRVLTGNRLPGPVPSRDQVWVNLELSISPVPRWFCRVLPQHSRSPTALERTRPPAV